MWTKQRFVNLVTWQHTNISWHELSSGSLSKYITKNEVRGISLNVTYYLWVLSRSEYNQIRRYTNFFFGIFGE